MRSLGEARSRIGELHGVRQNQGTQDSGWESPPTGWVKINTDGAFSHLSTGIGSGGLIRGEHGNFISGFMFKGEGGDSLSAELWGCLHGLKMTWDLGFRFVILESDSAEAVDLINQDNNEAHDDWALIAEIKSLLGWEWNTEVRHIRRGANAAADYLAKSSLASFPGFHSLHTADIELDRLIVMDNA
ncbi:hypothetical protein QN277_012850 [Acacia crassicarpa]|uniref:RNase H type-1 domain-containing protein n=1 Tax=Acacia crassicarpa TaxID=499986 RepID=A0AAE1TDG4_9FABA|nr:hypothetical protein QN277_012850 [Acacia crassicarpa]